MTHSEANLIQERYRITKQQSEWLKAMEEKHGIPPSAMVRLAIDLLMPRLSNMCIEEDNIVSLWRKQGF